MLGMSQTRPVDLRHCGGQDELDTHTRGHAMVRPSHFYCPAARLMPAWVLQAGPGLILQQQSSPLPVSKGSKIQLSHQSWSQRKN